jgi:hypothetical protein
VLRCRARPQNNREKRRASTAFDQRIEGGMGGGTDGAMWRKEGGSGAGGATRKKEAAWRGLAPAGTRGWRGGRQSSSAWVRQGMKGGSGRGGPRLGRCHVPTQVHSADFDLNKDFLNRNNSNDQKLALCCLKIFKQNMKL